MVTAMIAKSDKMPHKNEQQTLISLSKLEKAWELQERSKSFMLGRETSGEEIKMLSSMLKRRIKVHKHKVSLPLNIFRGKKDKK